MFPSLFLPYSPAPPNCLLINLHFATAPTPTSLEQCYDALLKYEARLIFHFHLCMRGF